MKRLFTHIMFLLSAILAVSCASDDDMTDGGNGPTDPSEELKPVRKTIIAYITGDNNLSSSLSNDLREMTTGSAQLPADYHLVVFADFRGEKPYIAHLKDGTLEKVRKYENEFYSTSPDSMRSVYQWIIDHYPAREYSTVLSGHGSGAIISSDTISTNLLKLNAYGYDGAGEVSATSTSTWMNVPSMAAVFGSLRDYDGGRLHFDYIFLDCCCFQTIEVAYEFRHITDFIVAPVSETPAAGADYEKMTAALSLSGEDAVRTIVDTYSANTSICISAIRTDMLDGLCAATRRALGTIYDGEEKLTLNHAHCIYYYRGNETGYQRQASLHDMKHIMRTNLEDGVYREWLAELEKAVVHKNVASRWETSLGINFSLFQEFLTDEYYGGVSMLVPDDDYTLYGNDINTSMFKLQWCNDVGWKRMGW